MPIILGSSSLVPITVRSAVKHLTAGFFETGAMPTPTKSQNPTICGWAGSFQSYLTHT